MTTYTKTWFETLFGFEETDYETTKNRFNYHMLENGETILHSRINNKTFPVGKFTTPSVKELVDNVLNLSPSGEPTTYEHRIITDIFKMHSENPGAVFQVASQFNCLEFPSMHATPEDGVTDYSYDYTQGPACAIACGAGTIYRNYFAPVSGYTGQTADHQINNLEDLENLLENKTNNYWEIKNGYIIGARKQIKKLNEVLEKLTQKEKYELIDHVRIGVQENVGVTFSERYIPVESDIRVTQCYCSALSCGYTNIPKPLWEPLARLVLTANYLATILVACANRSRSRTVFLTFLGGGVFQNYHEWIADAIGYSIYVAKQKNMGIHIVICHYRQIDEVMRHKIDTAASNVIQI